MFNQFRSFTLGSSKLLKGTLRLDSEETEFSFEYKSYGRRITEKSLLKGK